MTTHGLHWLPIVDVDTYVCPKFQPNHSKKSVSWGSFTFLHTMGRLSHEVDWHPRDIVNKDMLLLEPQSEMSVSQLDEYLLVLQESKNIWRSLKPLCWHSSDLIQIPTSIYGNYICAEAWVPTRDPLSGKFLNILGLQQCNCQKLASRIPVIFLFLRLSIQHHMQQLLIWSLT